MVCSVFVCLFGFLFYFCPASLDGDHPILYLPHSYDDRGMPPHLSTFSQPGNPANKGILVPAIKGINLFPLLEGRKRLETIATPPFICRRYIPKPPLDTQNNR
jgi:hypothetical protein